MEARRDRNNKISILKFSISTSRLSERTIKKEKSILIIDSRNIISPNDLPTRRENERHYILDKNNSPIEYNTPRIKRNKTFDRNSKTRGKKKKQTIILRWLFNCNLIILASLVIIVNNWRVGRWITQWLIRVKLSSHSTYRIRALGT